MTSLSDVYEGEVGRVATRRQQLVGTGLFLAGAAGLVAAIALATTSLGTTLGLGDYAAREIAGIVAGVGLPAVVLGIFAVLPAGPRTRLAAVGGAGVALVGVVAFQRLYPYSWMADAPLLALGASTVYFTGVLTTFWCLFAALATFKTRNDPGGTARMKVTEEGTIELVEESRSLPGLGGIGFFGRDPDGDVATQTNRRGTTTSDGGATQHTDGSEVMGQARSGPDPTTQQSHTTTQSKSTPQRPEKSAPRGPTEHELDPKLANAGPEASPPPTAAPRPRPARTPSPRRRSTAGNPTATVATAGTSST
ncbi:hypothetical protein ACFQER_04060 [Halomicroarcula sp. GCM10025894]|uniref:DUF7139 domain-containing protein n=1 Tax=Halomicroarcula sp. GCM10025894 TaxID=3252673 RepID=UPI00361F3764